VARTHKTLIWERTRQVQRLRHQLLDYFPAALEAFEDLHAPDTLELLARTPEPARAAKLTRAQVSAVLKRAGRRKITERATVILTALRGERLDQPPAVTAAYAVTFAVPDRGHHHLEPRSQDPAGEGGGGFWPAPGR
jgi:hypothetical protein